jgi:DNA-binding transcriptional ArsR family regulator
MGEHGELSKSGQVNSTNGNALHSNRATRREKNAWIPESVIEDPRLKRAFHVYAYLKCFADPEGCCRFCKDEALGAAKIGRALGMHRATVMRHLTTLERLGYVRRTPTFRSDGGKAFNRYWVAVNAPPHVAILRPTHVANSDLPMSQRCDIKNPYLFHKKKSARACAWEAARAPLEEFHPGEDIANWASRELPEIADARAPETIAGFKDHWRSRGDVPADLNAAYRNWLRGRMKFVKRPRGAAPQSEKVKVTGRNPNDGVLSRRPTRPAPTLAECGLEQ